MKRINLFLAERQIQQLRAVAAQAQLPMAEVLRRCLDVFLAGRMDGGLRPQAVHHTPPPRRRHE